MIKIRVKYCFLLPPTISTRTPFATTFFLSTGLPFSAANFQEVSPFVEGEGVPTMNCYYKVE